MSKYFDYFPELKYGDKVLRDITKNITIFDDIESDPYSYLPYTLRDGESAEQVAEYYYGSPRYVWLVYHSNNITDPYFDWPLSQDDLEKTIVKKYKAQAEASEERTLKDREVLEWTKNTTTNDNILYYYDAEGIRITRDTYLYGGVEAADWTVRRIYEEELELNEAKRDIRLLNKAYADVAVKNLKRELNG